MSQQLIDQLIASQEALIAALDGSAAEAIEQAATDFREAVAAVRSVGNWHDMPGVEANVRAGLKVNEAGRVRTNFLSDATRQRLETVARLRGRPAVPIAYCRDGRMAG